MQVNTARTRTLSPANHLMEDMEAITPREAILVMKAIKESFDANTARIISEVHGLAVKFENLQNGKLSILEREIAELKTKQAVSEKQNAEYEKQVEREFSDQEKRIEKHERVIWGAVSVILIQVLGLVIWKLTGH